MESQGGSNDPTADILALLARLLPSEPTHPQSRHAALVLLVHTLLVRRGFRLSGLGEEGNVVQTKELPPAWQTESGSEGTWTLRYRHPQSSLSYLVRAVRLGPTLLAVHALSLEDAVHASSLTITLSDYLVDDYEQGPITNTSVKGLQKLARTVSSTIFPMYSIEFWNVDSLTMSRISGPDSAAVEAPTTTSPAPRSREERHDPLRIGPERRPRPPYDFSSHSNPQLDLALQRRRSRPMGRAD